MPQFPAVTGKRLISYLIKDGWEKRRHARHGVLLVKRFGDRYRVTVVPDKSAPLPPGTLSCILGPKETGLGRDGLRGLLKKYGS